MHPTHVPRIEGESLQNNIIYGVLYVRIEDICNKQKKLQHENEQKKIVIAQLSATDNSLDIKNLEIGVHFFFFNFSSVECTGPDGR